jgi:hypothetical protein
VKTSNLTQLWALSNVQHFTLNKWQKALTVKRVDNRSQVPPSDVRVAYNTLNSTIAACPSHRTDARSVCDPRRGNYETCGLPARKAVYFGQISTFRAQQPLQTFSCLAYSLALMTLATCSFETSIIIFKGIYSISYITELLMTTASAPQHPRKDDWGSDQSHTK